MSQASLRLAKPATGATQTAVPAARLELGFDASEALFGREDNSLIIKADSGGSIIVTDFFVTKGESLPDFVLSDGAVVDGKTFLSAMNPNLDITTAAGPAAAPPSSGLNAYEGSLDSSVLGVERLGALGTDHWDRAAAAPEMPLTASALASAPLPAPAAGGVPGGPVSTVSDISVNDGVMVNEAHINGGTGQGGGSNSSGPHALSLPAGVTMQLGNFPDADGKGYVTIGQDPTGAYTYTYTLENATHSPVAGNDRNVDPGLITINVPITGPGGDQATLSIHVDVQDDMPFVAYPGWENVDASWLQSGGHQSSTQLRFGADGPADENAIEFDTSLLPQGSNLGPLTYSQSYDAATQTATLTATTATGQEVMTATLNAGGQITCHTLQQNLFSHGTSLDFRATLTDSDGDVAANAHIHTILVTEQLRVHAHLQHAEQSNPNQEQRYLEGADEAAWFKLDLSVYSHIDVPPYKVTINVVPGDAQYGLDFAFPDASRLQQLLANGPYNAGGHLIEYTAGGQVIITINDHPYQDIYFPILIVDNDEPQNSRDFSLNIERIETQFNGDVIYTGTGQPTVIIDDDDSSFGFMAASNLVFDGDEALGDAMNAAHREGEEDTFIERAAFAAGPDESVLAGSDGNDSVDIAGAVTGTAEITAHIITGAGDDLVSIGGSIEHAVVDLGAGDDTLHLDLNAGNSYANTLLNGGAGDDVLLLSFDNSANLEGFLNAEHLAVSGFEQIILDMSGENGQNVDMDSLLSSLGPIEGAQDIFVRGDAADTVRLSTDWAKDAQTMQDSQGHTYDVYRNETTAEEVYIQGAMVIFN